MYSSARMRTEVIVDPREIVPGEIGYASVELSSLSSESFDFNFDHGFVVGYRIKTSHGELMSWSPNFEAGEPTIVTVQPGEVTQLVFGFQTERPMVQTAYDPVTWLSPVGPLAEGNYIIEAGLYGLEGEFRWGRATFTLSGSGANPR